MTSFPVPAPSAERVRDTFGARGEAFLARLPELLAQLAERWSLSLEPPFPGISYHYVCPVTRADGSTAVLKVGVPNHEMRSEMAMLRLCRGSGIARLCESNFRQGALLLEHVTPGTTLVGCRRGTMTPLRA